MPDSRAPYVIICDSRIEVALAKTQDDKVRAVARGAATFAAFMETIYGSEPDFAVDLSPVTTMQHQLMDHATGAHKLDRDELDAKIKALIDAMAEMEHEYV